VREAFLQGSLSEADLKAGLVRAPNPRPNPQPKPNPHPVLNPQPSTPTLTLNPNPQPQPAALSPHPHQVLAVNGLLEPVRSHFNTDAEAKRILGLITGS